MNYLADAILVAVLAAATVTDLRSGRIYNRLVYPAIVAGLLLGLLDGGKAGLWNHALGAGVAFAALLFCFAIGGIGGGDVKLMTAVGALGGFARAGQGNFILYAMLYAFAIGAILGLVGALWRGVLGATMARTVLGLWIFTQPGTTLNDAVPKPSLRVPFGLATAVGVVWLLIENYVGISLGEVVSRLLS
jgi:prepilin peptidase CpaA